MKCERCGEDAYELAIIPLKSEKSPQTIACVSCAIKVGLYCTDHQKPHQGFSNGTAACLDCIEDLVRETEPRAMEFIYETLKENVSEESWRELEEWARASSELTKDSKEKCVYRAVITASLRFKMSIEKMLEKRFLEKGVNFML